MLLGCSGYLFAAAGPAEVITVRSGKTLEIKATLPVEISEVEIWIESDRNQRITKMSDVSKLNPAPPAANPAREVFYPVVDVALQPGMEGVMVFSTAPATCFLNQNVFKAPVAVGEQMVFPGERMGQWENAVFVTPGTVAVRNFHLRCRAPVSHGRLDRQIFLLSDQWSGRISLHTVAGGELGAARVASVTEPPRAAPTMRRSSTRA